MIGTQTEAAVVWAVVGVSVMALGALGMGWASSKGLRQCQPEDDLDPDEMFATTDPEDEEC